MPSNIRFAVVCSSNQNRSMETHLFLSKRGFKVRSFGTGDKVKLPGNAPDKPNVYDFGTPYETMYQDLMRKDKNLYTNNGILNMLDRNKRIKRAPEKFQLSSEIFDVIFTVEERVYDQVVEGGCSRRNEPYPEDGGRPNFCFKIQLLLEFFNLSIIIITITIIAIIIIINNNNNSSSSSSSSSSIIIRIKTQYVISASSFMIRTSTR
ncbi:RNA polymerase II subunit A C-terminal domain phosphatase SSU72-like isoform X1 [Varroa jacobsoni]|uniref:RNA polymerase II subunit A C-terminal domain phosphatase SSU72-like isoform X1 n=1 Tax=Varroa jacobsoni TaxID=62625 RepID=UPI000BF82BB2|nr:RNA polymerase II subunit A C-terminal domain phosphatase SSU72-like isoform X1 [Varroa jacobsoni]